LRSYETVAELGVVKGKVVRAALLFGLTLLVWSCRRPNDAGRPQPSASASSPPVAASGSPSEDARPWSAPEAAWFPEQAGVLARDLNADVSTFGAAGEPPVTQACALLGEECEKLDRLGLRRVLRVPYIGAAPARARAIATLLCFESPESAYAYFTGRIGAAVEAGKPAFSALPLAAESVFGDTTLLAWKADQVLELGFSDVGLAPERAAASARELLPPLAAAVSAALPGEATPLVAARLLPSAARKPLSVRYDRFDLAELPGLGPGARAEYAEGVDEYTLAIAVRGDFDAAEDVLETVRKLPGGRVLKNAPYRATRYVQFDEKSGRRTAWLFGQRDTVVLGVGAVLEPVATLRKYVPELDPNLRRLKKLLDGTRVGKGR
jgi:hypothetical protein